MTKARTPKRTPKKALIPWKCPKCGADADVHGKGGLDKCEDTIGRSVSNCRGLLCECDLERTGDDHGQSHDNPCPNAVCHHCTWYGTMPAEKREDAVVLLKTVAQAAKSTARPDPFEGVSDDQIRIELRRREEDAHRRHLEEFEHRFQLQKELLTAAVIDATVPKHARSSCSDTNICNGWGSDNADAGYRCKRCALLEWLDGSCSRLLLTLELGEREP